MSPGSLEHFRVPDYQGMYLHQRRCHDEVVLPVLVVKVGEGGCGEEAIDEAQGVATAGVGGLECRLMTTVTCSPPTPPAVQ